MAWEAKVILDSINPSRTRRITTMQVSYPRIIHSEMLTHRAFARNSASSRAIPWLHREDSKATTPTMRDRIVNDPFVPLVFGSEQSGMVTGGEVKNPDYAKHRWMLARDGALGHADMLHRMGVHRSLVNRVVEPWMFITVLITATEWENFFRLRCHPDAEIHFQKIAGMMREAREASWPKELCVGEWHLPFVSGAPDEDMLRGAIQSEALRKISSARCSRLSYLTQEGTRDYLLDMRQFERLYQGSGFGHWSPMEHPAQCSDNMDERSGPLVGWTQFRKFFQQESADQRADLASQVA